MDKDNQERFSHIYGKSPPPTTDPAAPSCSHFRGESAGGDAAAGAGVNANAHANPAAAGASAFGMAKGNNKVCAAVPTKKAAMEIEAGGGVDVREGQASVRVVCVVRGVWWACSTGAGVAGGGGCWIRLSCVGLDWIELFVLGMIFIVGCIVFGGVEWSGVEHSVVCSLHSVLYLVDIFAQRKTVKSACGLSR